MVIFVLFRLKGRDLEETSGAFGVGQKIAQNVDRVGNGVFLVKGIGVGILRNHHPDPECIRIGWVGALYLRGEPAHGGQGAGGIDHVGASRIEADAVRAVKVFAVQRHSSGEAVCGGFCDDQTDGTVLQGTQQTGHAQREGLRSAVRVRGVHAADKGDGWRFLLTFCSLGSQDDVVIGALGDFDSFIPAPVGKVVLDLPEGQDLIREGLFPTAVTGSHDFLKLLVPVHLGFLSAPAKHQGQKQHQTGHA